MITKGKNLYDFFIIPTIRIESKDYYFSRLTFEWLNFYIGFIIRHNREDK